MTCIIIEDEIPAQNILKNFLGKLPNVELKGAFQSATEVRSFLKNETVDFVFLDINLPDISGIDFIKTIKNPPAIIMTTAYPDYAAESFSLETIVDYLVKPFSFDRFLKAINKAEQFIDKSQNTSEETNSEILFLNVDKTHHKVIVDDILFLESDRNYITIVTKTQKLSYIDSLKSWVEKLPETNFIQIHKSFIINSNSVDKIAGNTIYIGSNKLPIGRSFKQELLKQLKIT
ncbi:LytTR family DNA-binding domain-containing protein [uncultured Lacinutrix sp.]|uniref:LytR/AlgR family response regulator transcription factor n=1 Tax=uncultured Lacinutrix sp. TaxID=574032 RepID=UPI00260AEDA5|nr:LytTR family DNA-binding domain-containing protein [uncultured Lacinutrix sp.]